MTKADKHKSQKKPPNDDVIEGDATIIEDAAQTSSKPETPKSDKKKASSSSFPKLAFGALVLAILSLAASLYMMLMIGAVETKLASQKAAFEKAQSQIEQSQIKALDSVTQSRAKIEQINTKLGGDVEKLAAAVDSLKRQMANRDKTSPLSSSAPLELSVVMMIWAEASSGENLDRFAPIVNRLPASQTKTSLIDILALAGDSTHEALRQRAMRPRKISSPQGAEDAPSGLLDGLTSWLGHFVKLRPVETPTNEEVFAEKQSKQITSSPPQDQDFTSLESLYAYLSSHDSAGDDRASWLIETKARLEADKALTSLLQTLISDEIKG